MPGETAGGNILVVDDSRENLRLLATVLKRGGLHPRPVTSGALAIEAGAISGSDGISLTKIRQRFEARHSNAHSMHERFANATGGAEAVEALELDGAVDFVIEAGLADGQDHLCRDGLFALELAGGFCGADSLFIERRRHAYSTPRSFHRDPETAFVVISHT